MHTALRKAAAGRPLPVAITGRITDGTSERRVTIGKTIMICNYDIHIHTRLSSCASPDATLQSYLESAERLGLDFIGISNHMWDSAIPGASSWYLPQTFAHIAAIRQEIAGTPHRIPVYFGCETEFTHQNVLAISEPVLDQLDYVLAPHSHTHMRLVMPPDEYDTDEKHAAFLVRSFLALAAHPLAKRIAAVAHPFSPGTRYARYNAILSHITDAQLRECCLAAKEAGLFAELNISVILPFLDETGVFHGENERFFRMAKECGVKFTWGSDSHQVYDQRLEAVCRFLETCGIEQNDFATRDEILDRNRQ